MSFLKQNGIVFESEKEKRINGIKNKYGALIKRIAAADIYLENELINIEVRMKSLDLYNLLVEELSKLQLEYKQITGEEMNIKNKLNGF